MKVKVDGPIGTQFKGIQYLHAALSSSLENEPRPFCQLAFAKVAPPAAKVGPSQINQITNRRGLGAEPADPVPNYQRPGAVDDHVKLALEEPGEIRFQGSIQSTRNVIHRDPILQADVPAQVDLDNRSTAINLFKRFGQAAVDGRNGGSGRVFTLRAVSVDQNDRFHKIQCFVSAAEVPGPSLR